MVLTVETDSATRAILAHLDCTLQRVMDGCRAVPREGGEDHVFDLPWMAGTDHQAPSIILTGDHHTASGARLHLGDDVTLFGAEAGGDCPMIVVAGRLIPEIITTAAKGRPLQDVFDVAAHPALLALTDATVAEIATYDGTVTGGPTYSTVSLDPQWRRETVDTRRGQGSSARA